MMSTILALPQRAEANLPCVTEESLAHGFVTANENVIRFDHRSGLWYLWDGFAWRANHKRLVMEWVRETVRGYGAGESSKLAKEYGRISTCFGIDRLAGTDKRVAVLAEEFDQDPMLLGTPGGTVDLVTGELRAPDPHDLISRTTVVAPSGDGRPPRWLAFLREATGKNGQMIAYLQHLAGYCLTGLISEQALYFLYGPGGNGKSVFLNTLGGIMGDYAVVAPMATFTAAKHERHETELAMLRGARLVRASETEEGRGWAEARIKAITGGEPISARFMRRDHFSFLPVFKLVITGNHKPHLRSVDRAISRRLRILTWDYVPDVVDPELEAKLKEEWPLILQWMIDGCLAWQETGQFPYCAAVNQSTQDYLYDQDTVWQFVEQACESNELPINKEGDMDGLYRTAVRILFKGFVIFCESKNENPGGERRFTAEIEKKGYIKKRYNSAVSILGLRLKDDLAKRVAAMVSGV